jgi:hypothetical protein
VLCRSVSVSPSERPRGRDGETVRSISGLVTRGVSLTGQLNSQNDSSGGSHHSLIFSECTSSLRIGLSRITNRGSGSNHVGLPRHCCRASGNLFITTTRKSFRKPDKKT